MTITMTEEQFEELAKQAMNRRGLTACRLCGALVAQVRLRDGVCSMCRIFNVALVARDEDLEEAWPEEEEDDGEGGETFDAGEGGGEGEDAQA